MQKQLRINLLARNQTLKRAHRKNVEATKEEWSQYHLQKDQNEKKARQYVKEERMRRREDWMLGPLAPNRNTGLSKGVYGTIDIEAIQHPSIPKSVQGTPKTPGFHAYDYEGRDAKMKFKGKTIVGNVVVGDRVVIVHGPERLKGVIGHVMTVDNDREEVRLQNVNVADVRVPPGAPQATDADSSDAAKYNTQELPIPMSHIRLIWRIHDSKTNEDKDVIIRHVHADGPYAQRAIGSNLPAHTRYITGSGAWSDNGTLLEIAWPDDDLEQAPRKSEVDTDRNMVERITWTPSIHAAPLGYYPEVEPNLQKLNEPSSPYTLGLIRNPLEATNLERAGLHGFTNDKKAMERHQRITRGIMDELRVKTRRDNTQHDDSTWVKTKIIEDARAIWWRDRKVVGPAVEAAGRLVEQRKKERDNRIISDSRQTGTIVVEEVQKIMPENFKVGLPAETLALIEEVQAANSKSIYKKADVKFQKRLDRLQAAI